MTWVLVALVLLLIYGFFIEPRWFHLTRHTLKTNKPLPRPLKILHISDMHFHPENTHIRRFFDKLRGLPDIDLVLITGDIIDVDNGIVLAAQELKTLKSRFGTFVVFGNHDHYWYGHREMLKFIFRHVFPRFPNNVALLKHSLEAIGCRVLINESCCVDVGGATVHIAGLDDPVTYREKPEKVAKPSGEASFNILLSHLLDPILKMKSHGFDLALAGHTHGGQWRLPFWGPIFTDSLLHKKYAAGLEWIENTCVHTSRGMSMSPMLASRYFCRPEATLFTIITNKDYKERME